MLLRSPQRVFAPFLIVLLIAGVTSTAGAQNLSTASEVLTAAQSASAARWADVQNYTIVIAPRLAPVQVPTYYESLMVDGQKTFRLVGPAEYNRRMAMATGIPAPESIVSGMGQALSHIGSALNIEGLNMAGMMAQMGAFGMQRAASPRQSIEDAEDDVTDMAEFMRRARLVGIEPTRSSSTDPDATRNAYLLVADDVSDIQLEQPSDGGEFTMKQASLWIDVDKLVPVRLLIDVEVENKGKTTPVTIEKLDLDYKQVGPLYESFNQSYKLTGIMEGMSDKDRRKMEKAAGEIEEMKAKLDEVPDAQRAMVDRFLKPKIEELEAMLAGDAFESIVDVKTIAVNEGPPTPYGLGLIDITGFQGFTVMSFAAEGDDPTSSSLTLSGGDEDTFVSIDLESTDLYPAVGSTISFSDAGGRIVQGQGRILISGGSGSITVTARTETHIKGTFSGSVHEENGRQYEISGFFDSGAPTGPFQAPRGSPFDPAVMSGALDQ